MALLINGFAITLVAGMAFASYSRYNLQSPYAMDRAQRQGPYGATVANERNRNCNIQADSTCHGSIVDNRNSNCHCENSSVEMLSNRNTEVSAVSSTLNVKSNSNTVIEAENVHAKFEDNANLNFKGSGLNNFLSQFVGNRNCQVEGMNNKVVATDNRNLSIDGNDNQLEISRTRNHIVRPATRNTLRISKEFSSITNFTFHIGYVQSARIDGSNYRLGNYSFDVAQSDDMIRVTLRDGSVWNSTSNKIVVGGQGEQSLELIGQRVEILSPNSFNIY